MTAIGTTRCAVLGCERRRHVSGDGRVVYAHCLMHALAYLRGAFGTAA